MKKKLFAYLFVLALFSFVTVQPSMAQVPAKTTVQAGNGDEDELVAYSDSIVNEDWNAGDSITVYDSDDVFDERMERMMERMAERFATPGAIFVAVIAILAVLLFFLAPFIALILIIRYFVKRNNARVRLAEKAMETGQPIPDELRPIDRQSSPYLRQRGIRNIALGLGLFAMFYFWHSSTLQGIGALIAIYGFGQYYLSRTPLPKDDEFINTKVNGEDKNNDSGINNNDPIA